FAGKFLKRWLKIIFAKENSRQVQTIKLAAKFFRVDERRTENLKRPCRAPAFGNVRSLEQTHSRINGRGIERRHVRRRHHPGQSGLIEPHRAFPILHRQDRQSAFRKGLIAKLSRQFADRLAVANWNWMKADERFVTFLNRRTFDGHAVDRIWPIEHDDVHASLRTRTHAEIKRPNESVVARADVLEIDNQGVETGEHFRRRLAMLTVQTVNRNFQPRMLVTFPFDHVVLGLAEK